MSSEFDQLNSKIKQIYKILNDIYHVLYIFKEKYYDLIFLLKEAIFENNLDEFKEQIQYYKTTDTKLQDLIKFCLSDLKIITLKEALIHIEAYANIDLKEIIKYITDCIKILKMLISSISIEENSGFEYFRMPIYKKVDIYTICTIFHLYNNSFLYSLLTDWSINEDGFIGYEISSTVPSKNKYYIHTDGKIYYGLKINKGITTNRILIRAGEALQQNILYLQQLLTYCKKI